MIVPLSNDIKKIYVHTGNILNLNEVKKKAGQNVTDELVEILRITLAELQTSAVESSPPEILQVRRQPEGTSLLLHPSEERKDLKVGLKLFLPATPPYFRATTDALDCLLQELNTGHVETLVLALVGRQSEGSDQDQKLQQLQSFWGELEEEVDKGRVLNVGVSDLETELFVSLHNSAKVKPSIVQINLASCCVVPPALQAFTKEKEVQLLTHSDPLDLLPESKVTELFGEGWRLGWVVRSQVHVKCRGVLASKGYIVCIERA